MLLAISPILTSALCTRPVAPQPPREAAAVIYGREAGKLKGVDDALLLEPPVSKQDDLFHLRDKSRMDTLEHIKAENAYVDAVLHHSPDWQAQTDTLLRRLLASSASMADGAVEPRWRRTSRRARWEYGQRMDPARGPYPIYVRRRTRADSTAADGVAAEQELLDANAAPVLMESPYQAGVAFSSRLRGVCVFRASSGGQLAAYTVDTTGEEKFCLNVARLGDEGGIQGGRPEVALTDVDVDFVWGGGAQAASDAAEAGAATAGGLPDALPCAQLYYVTLDETGRPWRVHRRRFAECASLWTW